MAENPQNQPQPNPAEAPPPLQVQPNPAQPALLAPQQNQIQPLLNQIQDFPSLNQPFSVKLDTTNHLLWQTQMLNIIIANGIEGYIDGSTPCPPQFLDAQGLQLNPEFTQWRRLNRLVMSWIYSSLTEGMMGRIVGLSTAREIWDSLNQVYQSASISTILCLKTQLMSIKKGGLTITEYLDKLKTNFDKFAAIGEPLSYRDKIIHTFRGLGPAYDSIVSSISARPDRPPMEEIHNILINHDYRLEEQQSVDNLGLTQAQLTQLAQLNLSQLSQPKAPQKQYFPNPTNTFKPQNFSPNYSKPQNATRNQNFHYSPFSNNRPGILRKPIVPQTFNPWPKQNNRPPGHRDQCQICLKFGHTANVCHHRTNLKYQTQAPQGYSGPNLGRSNGQSQPNAFAAMLGTSNGFPASSSSETPWYLDSGATHHFTPDLSALDSPMPYVGEDQVMVGNGHPFEENSSAGTS